MIVEKFGSNDIKQIEDPPPGYSGCIYCYAASKSCHFYADGDVHFIRVEGDLRAVRGIKEPKGMLSLDCKAVTEEQARALIAEHSAYN